MPPDPGPWEPMTPAEVVDLLAPMDRPWWIAGGWAIDLHLGRTTREHGDIDVLILREDQLVLQQVLDGWDLHAADPPGALPRPRDEADFLAARDSLSAGQRSWLARALRLVSPTHHWLTELCHSAAPGPA